MRPPLDGNPCAALVAAQSGVGAGAVWIAILLAVVIAASIALFWLRRRLLGDDDEAVPIGLSLDNLRRMHARGELTDDEFAAAKRVAIGEAGYRAEAAPETINPITGARRAKPGFDLLGNPLPRDPSPPG